MLEEGRQDILNKNYFINKRKNARLKTRFLASKHRTFLLGILLGLIGILVIYYLLPISNIFTINVENNRYFSDEYYVSLSGLDTNGKFYLVSLAKAKKAIKQDEIIESVSVKRDDFNTIDIVVNEKLAIGYTYEYDEPKIIFADGSEIPFEDKYVDLISKLAYIEGFEEEYLLSIAKYFKDIDYEMLNEVSEIHRYPFTYDDQMMEFIMRDGSYVYVSRSGLSLLNNYYTIKSGVKNDNKYVCIFLDEVTNSGYTSECPFWNVPNGDTNDIEDDA